MPKLRVQRILQQAGLASRRTAEEWIAQGRVTVDGRRVEVGARADPERETIALDGIPVTPRPAPPAYVLLNKPSGYTTSLKDRHAEHLVSELIPARFGRLFPVGRLDRESQGLLLMTNDGQLAHALMHPARHIPKVYEVWVKGVPHAAHLQRLRRGIMLDEGPATLDSVEVLRRESGRSLIRVVLHEGKKREVRRIFDSVGHPVEQLVRVRYGTLSIQGLESGHCRPLTNREVRELKALAAGQSEGEQHESGRKQGKSPSQRTKHPDRGPISTATKGHVVGHARGDSGRPHR